MNTFDTSGPDTWCLTPIEFRMSMNADPNASFSLSTWILKSPTIKTYLQPELTLIENQQILE